jgi:hypothetical protein
MNAVVVTARIEPAVGEVGCQRIERGSVLVDGSGFDFGRIQGSHHFALGAYPDKGTVISHWSFVIRGANDE